MSLVHLEVRDGAHKECHWQQLSAHVPEWFSLSTTNSLGT